VREIRWTPESEEHIWGHRVTPDQVEQVVYTRPRLALKGRDGTTCMFGQTDAGRYLMVVLSESQAGGFYVVTARDMTEGERRTFRSKAR
jgi:hypothetical protein